MDATLAATGEPLPPDWALQDPEDYRDVLREAVPAALAAAGTDPALIVGIGTDFTACTVMPVLADGTPLCQLPQLAGRPHAYPKLWKHHAAQPQADRINALAHERHEPWIGRYGGKISSEWEFAKALQLLEEDPEVYQQTSRWIEAADWIIWQLTGVETQERLHGRVQGHPAGRPLPVARVPWPAASRVRHVRRGQAGAPGAAAGPQGRVADRRRRPAWTGLPEGIAVAVGNVDAHVTAPAAAAIAPGQMVAIMGTSTCHVMNGTRLAEVPGMCGVVDGGIVAGMWGYEAGQSGVGDIFAWFAEHAGRSRIPGGGGAARHQSVQELLDAEAAAAARRRARADRARLAERQPQRARRPSPVRR